MKFGNDTHSMTPAQKQINPEKAPRGHLGLTPGKRPCPLAQGVTPTSSPRRPAPVPGDSPERVGGRAPATGQVRAARGVGTALRGAGGRGEGDAENAP